MQGSCVTAEIAFLAAKACISLLCDEAARLRTADSPADRARSAQLLKAAGTLHATLRDRLLCVPACEAASRRDRSPDDQTSQITQIPMQTSQPPSDTPAAASPGAVCSDRDCPPSPDSQQRRRQQQLRQRQKQQRARAAQRLVQAIDSWCLEQEAFIQQLITAPATTNQPGSAGIPPTDSSSTDRVTSPDPSPSPSAACSTLASGPPAKDPSAAARIDPCTLARRFQECRRAALKAELDDCAAASQQLPQQVNGKFDQLLTVVRHLRAVEGDLAFHSRLARAAAAAADKRGCRDDASFAYGSTSFSSWLQVHRHPAVSAAAKAAMRLPLEQSGAQQQQREGQPGQPGQQQQEHQRQQQQQQQQGDAQAENDEPQQHKQQRSYMVWGSSIGWLVFYGALAFEWHRCVGVEILPCLVQEARLVATQLGLQGISFECGNLLDSSLEGVGVLQLTEQCWDEDLVRKAVAKIQAELAPGALVIDYTGVVVGRLGPHCCLLAVQEVTTSWGTMRMHAGVLQAAPLPAHAS